MIHTSSPIIRAFHKDARPARTMQSGFLVLCYASGGSLSAVSDGPVVPCNAKPRESTIWSSDSYAGRIGSSAGTPRETGEEFASVTGGATYEEDRAGLFVLFDGVVVISQLSLP